MCRFSRWRASRIFGGDGAGGGMHGSRARGVASNAVVRRGALARETRLAAGVAARGGRGRERRRRFGRRGGAGSGSG